MSDSNSDKKEIIEADVVLSESNTDSVEVKAETVEDVKKVKKTPKAKKAKKTETEAAAEKTVVNEAVIEEVIIDKEDVIESSSIESKKAKKVSKSYASTSVYLSIAASVLIAVVLTIVTFFYDEYESVVAGLQSADVDSVLVSNSTATTQNADIAVSKINNVQVSDQLSQVNNNFQPAVMNQSRNEYFNEVRKNQRANYETAKRMHDKKMAEMYEARMATFKLMNEERIDRQNKIKVVHTKIKNIQSEMHQKMQAAYAELNSL